MSSITTQDGASIYYKDWGSGRPVVFSHGLPLNADARHQQMFFLASTGFRCIAHDGAATDDRVTHRTATTSTFTPTIWPR